MKKRVCLLALLAVLLPTDPAAPKDVSVLGAGMNSCGSWTKAQARRPRYEADGSATITDMQVVGQTLWVEGFLSAFNHYDSKSGNVTEGTDTNGIFAWIDSYCAAHPLDNIVAATSALISELSKRAGQ